MRKRLLIAWLAASLTATSLGLVLAKKQEPRANFFTPPADGTRETPGFVTGESARRKGDLRLDQIRHLPSLSAEQLKQIADLDKDGRKNVEPLKQDLRNARAELQVLQAKIDALKSQIADAEKNVVQEAIKLLSNEQKEQLDQMRHGAMVMPEGKP